MAVVGGGRGGGGGDGGGMCISWSPLCLWFTVQSRMTFNFLSSYFHMLSVGITGMHPQVPFCADRA